MNEIIICLIGSIIFLTSVVLNILFVRKADKRRTDLLKKQLEEMGHSPLFIRRGPTVLRRVIPPKNKKEE